MRTLHALIIATGLCVPSLALAAPSEQVQRPASTQAAAPQAASHSDEQRQVVARDRHETVQSDRARYAEKDAKAGEAKDYRGGDTLVIGASAATAILAVLLLVVLL